MKTMKYAQPMMPHHPMVSLFWKTEGESNASDIDVDVDEDMMLN